MLAYWSRHISHDISRDRQYCRSLSVSGTNITLIKGRCLTLPSRVLSTCTNVWSEFSGPIGTIKRPPGANWSINCKSKDYQRITLHSFEKVYFLCCISLTGCGISLAAAPTWIASYGPRSAYPNLPSPTKLWFYHTIILSYPKGYVAKVYIN